MRQVQRLLHGLGALLVLGGLWLLPAATVRANTLTVTSCSSGGAAGDGTLAGEIAAAIANPGATIVFTAGLNCTSTGTGPIPAGTGFYITHDLTIDGSGASIVLDGGCTWPGSGGGGCLNDGNGRPVFRVYGGTVALNALTIQHGYSGSGGGIDNRTTLTVTNCTITQNSAGGANGNGIYNSGTLTVTNSILSYNTSAVYNGSNGGGGIYSSGTLHVTNSALNHNGTSGSTDGGGIDNDGGTATVTNSTFSANTTGGNGGGINNNGGTLAVTNSTFSQNSGTYGGGIHNSGTATVTNSTFSGPTIATYGGGIANTGSGTLAVTNSTFSPHNNPIQGGGIYNSGTLTTVTNSTIAGNGVSGTTTGGGIDNSSGTVTLTNTIVASNAGGDLVGTFSGNNNLIDDTSAITGSNNITNTPALLGTLGNNGGPTQTVPLLAGSPAIDHGDDATCANTSGIAPVAGKDQRGTTRPQGPHCDIGAFELASPPPTPTAVHVTGATNSSLSWTWTELEPSASIAYTVDGVHVASLAPGTNAFTLSGIAHGSYGCIAIAAYTSAGASAYTPWSCSYVVPVTPHLPAVSAATTSSVSFAWTNDDPSSYIAGYDGTTNHALGQNATAYTAPTAAGYYACITVAAYNASYTSPFSAWVCGLAKPAMPTAVHVTGHTGTSVSFAWTNSDPYSGVALTNDGVHLLNEGINATSYTQSGMTAGQYSCIALAAYNSSGVSGYTTWVCGQAG